MHISLRFQDKSRRVKHKVCGTLFLLAACCMGQAIGAGEPSRCYGRGPISRLENGVALPAAGNNFEGHTGGPLAGRAHVHSTVRDIIVAAYAELEREQPGKLYKYDEAGFAKGGKYRTYDTWKTGLSMDFIVPVLNRKGESVQLPTHLFNKSGYEIEFDGAGNYGEYSIDFEAMAAHLVELHKAALNHGIYIRRVIFNPELRELLFQTPYAEYLRENIRFNEKPARVKHDEHYQVHFSVHCEP